MTGGRGSTRAAGQVSLERALSKLGIASRSRAHLLILDGAIEVDGRVITDPGHPVVPERIKVRVNGVEARAAQWRTVMLHKPRGTVTTASDPQGRATVYDVLEKSGLPNPTQCGLVPVGRLDWASTGLLLLTTDTRLADWLTDPANSVPKVYVVFARGLVTEAEVNRMTEGLTDAGEWLKADVARLQKASGRESQVMLTLSEGKNREIRRLLAACGHEVTRLKRVAFGGLTLGDLAPGAWRDVTADELVAAAPRAPIRPGSSPARH